MIPQMQPVLSQNLSQTARTLAQVMSIGKRSFQSQSAKYSPQINSSTTIRTYQPKTVHLTKIEAQEFQDWYKSSPLSHINPYTDYKEFNSRIQSALLSADKPKLIDRMAPLLQQMKASTQPQQRVLLIKNCPEDDHLPILSATDPVQERRDKKTYFGGECLQSVLATASQMPILGYTTRNDGELFQDVKAVKKYDNTQTQKTAHQLSFHNDRTAHPVRADYLMLRGLRIPKENEVFTTYIDKFHILPKLSSRDIELLSTKQFETPFDDFSKDSFQQHNASSKHNIIYGQEQNIRLYVGRTKPSDNATPEAKAAFSKLIRIIENANVCKTIIGQDDLFIFPNLGGLHSRAFGQITNKDSLYDRWILKTYNFASQESMMKHQDYFLKGIDGLVDDSKVNISE